MPHIMIDNETMGISSNAAVIQIGATAFDPFDLNGPLKAPNFSFERSITLQSALVLGCTVDQSTIDWWKRQNPEAQQAVVENAQDIGEVMRDFIAWYKSVGTVLGVWSHGASFDIPQLEFIIRALGWDIPWGYNLVRDTRTVHWLAEEKGWKKSQKEVKHTALADASAQVVDLQSALKAVVPEKFF